MYLKIGLCYYRWISIYRGLVEEQIMKGYTQTVYDLGIREVRINTKLNTLKRKMKFKGY